MRFSIGICTLALLFASGLFAQTGSSESVEKDKSVMGVVKVVGSEKIVLDTNDGSMDAVILSGTVFKRLSPDNLKQSAAVDAAFADIAVADRVVVTGKISDDKKSIFANKIFLVKGEDLEAQAAKRRAEWQQRGISGRVTAVDAATGSLTVKVSRIVGADAFVKIAPKENAVFRRYSKQSARYSDAVISSLSSVSVGDNLQALGDKSEDGTSFAAEEVLTGAFVTVAGTIKSIDAEKNEVTILDVMTGGEIKISIVGTSLVKRFPEETAKRLALFQAMGGGAGAGGQGAGSGQRPRQGQRGGSERPAGDGQGPGGGRGMGDINDMINRFPSINATELNVGELIAVSSSKSEDPSHLTAIKLLAGVGPFLAAQSSSGSRGGRGVSAGVNVPGLDSFDF